MKKKKLVEKKDDLLDDLVPEPDDEPELSIVDVFQSDDPKAFEDAVRAEVVKSVSAETNIVIEPEEEPASDKD